MTEEASADSKASSERDVRFGALIIAGHALKHLQISGLLAILLPEIKLSLALTSTQIGTIASAQQFSGWISTVGSGYLGDRYLRKTGLLLGLSLALMGLAYLLLGAARDYPLLLVGMLVMGLGVSMYHPPALGALARRFPHRRSLAISLHGAGGSVGEVLGPVTAAALLTFLVWNDILLIGAIPAFVGGGLLWLLLSGRGSQGAEGSAPTFGEYVRSLLTMLRQRALLWLCLATALRTAGQSTINVFLPIYLREDLDYTSGLVGLYISLAQVAGIGSQPLMGHLTDRYGHKRVLVPSLLLMAVLLLLIPVAGSRLELAVVILLLGAFLFSLHAILVSAATRLAGENLQATVVALVYAASFLGALAPTLAGILADAAGLKSTFTFSFVLVMLSALAISRVHLPVRQTAA